MCIIRAGKKSATKLGGNAHGTHTGEHGKFERRGLQHWNKIAHDTSMSLREDELKLVLCSWCEGNARAPRRRERRVSGAWQGHGTLGWQALRMAQVSRRIYTQ